MKLTFLGTRSSETSLHPDHRLHSALLVESGAERIMIDCGADWRDQLREMAPSALLLTHAHDDHAGGLSLPYPCPVYASEDCWQALEHQGHTRDRLLENRELSLVLGDLKITPFAAGHSLRAPMTGLRICGPHLEFVYLPDVADLTGSRALLFNADLYIGDGTSFGAELTRHEGGQSCGHAAITTQLAWAAGAGVRQVLFTHCGSTIQTDTARAERTLKGLAACLGLQASFAADGMSLDFTDRT